MLNTHFFNLLCKNLEYTPTLSQNELLIKLADFIVDKDDLRTFIVSGFAGTGKTSVISALVKTLKEVGIKSVLLAPTGRAAKVLATYSGESAYTIHKKIYRQKTANNALNKFKLDKNMASNTLFIVDEASMISNEAAEQSMFGSGRLLDDLIDFIKSGKSCRLILVGDRAQLPPVGCDKSPALDNRETMLFPGTIKVNITDVVRQAANSGILSNANKIRYNIDNEIAKFPKFNFSNFCDVELIKSADFIEKIENEYSRCGMENTIVISYSNKRANRYNFGIRSMIFGRDEELVRGDLLMVVKNCYQFLENNPELDFIANGDIAEVVNIGKYEEIYGFRFVNVLLRFIDYNGAELNCKIMLDTLTVEASSLSFDKSRELYNAISEDYSHLRTKRKIYQAVRENLYFNALQVKYAYAITCHKAQGGQWNTVFLDKLFFRDGTLSINDLRWLYTAFTRATQKLYLVDFDERYLE